MEMEVQGLQGEMHVRECKGRCVEKKRGESLAVVNSAHHTWSNTMVKHNGQTQWSNTSTSQNQHVYHHHSTTTYRKSGGSVRHTAMMLCIYNPNITLITTSKTLQPIAFAQMYELFSTHKVLELLTSCVVTTAIVPISPKNVDNHAVRMIVCGDMKRFLHVWGTRSMLRW